MMKIEEIKTKVGFSEYVYSHHAEVERRADNLTFAQIEEALLVGEILEEYPDTGRGDAVLVLGFSGEVPIHVVCGRRGDKLSLITVYVPRPPKWTDPRTRGDKNR